MDQHQLQEERSIAYHRALAEKIDADPSLLEQVQSRLSLWHGEGKIHPRYAEAWRQLLESPLAELRRRLIDPGEEMRALRQCTPFVGILTPQERWTIWREVREQLVEP